MKESEESILEILHVEDNPADAELVKATLKEAGVNCNIIVVKTRKDFEKTLKEKKFDIILSDFSLPTFGGKEAFAIARVQIPDTPFVFVSGTLGEDAAIQALVDGATDYVLKTKMTRLVPAVTRALREAESRRKLKLAESLRELALEDLKTSEARFRGVLESAPDPALIIDSSGKITFANSQTETVFGFRKDELIGRRMDILIPDRYKKMHERHVFGYNAEPHARALNSGLELFGKRKDGSEFPADIMLSPLVSERDVSVLAMIRDVTESKRAQKVLHESEELFRSIYHDSPVAITNVDAEGRIFRSNPAVTKLLGYSAEELQNMHFNDFTFPDDREIGTKMIEDLRMGKKDIVNFEKRYVRKSGEVIRANLTVSAVRSPDKTVRYMITIAQDVTEKWQAEESLRRSEEQYRNLVDNARDAIYTLSPQGTILSLNPAFETLTGWRREEWKGRSFTDLIHPEDRPKAVDLFRRTLGGELTDVITYRIKTKLGEFKVGEFSTTRFVMENGDIGILGIARDVTAQMAVEEQLRQSQKMESIGTLAGGIAHDFNNILGIIIGYASLTLRNPGDEKRVGNNIKAIETAAQRGVGLVRQLLMFARKQERDLQYFNINDIVQDLVKMIRETFPKVISVEFSKGDENLVTYCDQTEIHQAVLNICVNARDAMMERTDGRLPGGTLALKTELLPAASVKTKHSEAVDQDYISVSISDNGVGMDEETILRIYEPFFTTKERGKGTGLGLSMVYGIVSSLNGYIDVSSQLNKGTLFTLLLPVNRPPEPEIPKADVHSHGNFEGTETILVVEDEPGLRELLYDILSGQGYKVLLAEDGQRALAVFLDNREISAVISDIGLPNVGGLDLYQAIRKLNKEVKVIMVSGFVNESDRESMLDGGVHAFLQKPYQPADVLRKLRDVLNAG